MPEDDTKYRIFFENSADAMLIIENDEFVDCNFAAVSMLGYNQKEELINTSPFELSPKFQPDGQSSFDKANEMMRLARENGRHRFEWDHLRKDGSIIPVEVSLTVIESVRGIQLHTVWRDNTEIIERTNALANSEKNYRELFEQSPIGLALCAMDGSLVSINTAYAKIIGYDIDEALELTYWEITPEKYAAEEKSQLEKLEKEGRYGPYEKEYRHKDGHLVAVRLNGMIVVRNNQKYIWSSVEDISSLKEAEEKAQQVLVRTDQMKTEFISTAAHELRTPLSAIMGFAEILIDENNQWGFSEEQKMDFIKDIYDRGDSLKGIIDDLLDISRIESGQSIDLKLEDTRIHNVVTKSVDLFKAQNMKHTIKLSVAEEVVTESMKIDRHRITQVLENLLSNAVKYSPEGSTVSVTCKKINHHVEVSINDNGIGMAEGETLRVFDKFYRADSSATAVGGLGLGMSIAKQIIEAHSGKIWVDSIKGKGSTFTFSLPVKTVDS